MLPVRRDVRRHRRSSAAAAAALVLMASSTVRAVGQSARSDEDRIKAAVVSKITQFVDWPSTALAGRTSIDVCVAEPDRFGSDLAELAAGERVKGRDLAVRIVSTPHDLENCQLLFVPGRVRSGRHPLLASAESLPILTVGDYPTFMDDGGIVQLRMVDGRVRFDINLVAARHAGIQVSSQLLRLAVTVRGGGPA
jgi:hypothetical protein